MAIIPRGNNTYLVRVYLGRDPITRKRLEKNVTTRGTLAGAKKKEAKMKGEKELGCLGRIPSMTLNTLFDLYTAWGRHVQAESTQEKDRAYFDYYVRPFLGTMPLKKIDTGMIQNLFNFLLDKKETGEDNEKVYKAESGKGLAPSTVRNVRKVLAAAFNYAVSQKLTAGNPVHKTKLPPAAATTANSLTFEEAQSFDAVKEKFWYGDAFVFQLHTGLRPQELMALVWEDVDFDKGTLRVERACIWIRGIFKGFGPPKCKRSKRVIGLDPKHLEFLKIQLAKQQKHIEGRTINGGTYGEPKIEEWVMRERPKQSHLYSSARLIFPKPDGGVSNRTALRTDFKGMLKCAGIQSGLTNYRWYDLRHTHATFLLTLRVPIHEVAERLGHSVDMLLNIYAH